MKSFILYMMLFFSLRCFGESKTDLVIFSYDRPMQLYALLESVHLYISGLDSISVIYRVSSNEFLQGYKQIQAYFNQVKYIKQGHDPYNDFKQLTLAASFKSSNEYILFGVDDNIVIDYIDLNQCIDLMDRYQAYAFYLRLGFNLTECYSMCAFQDLPPLLTFANGVYAWRFCDGKHDWAYPHTVDFTLYRKNDLISFFQETNYYSPNSLEGAWANTWRSVMQKHGLCYQHTKAVNLPLNRVQHECHNRSMHFMTTEQLLQLFNQGLKIDIAPLHKIDNVSAHMEYEPIFISR